MTKIISMENIPQDDSTDVKVKQKRIMMESNKISGIMKVVLTRKNGDVKVLTRNNGSDWTYNLLTNEGRDAIHASAYQLASSTQEPFNFIGLSLDVGAPAVTDTRTTWELIEITTGGLVRVQFASRTHNVGDNFTTLVQTFTASAIHTAVQKAGLLDVLGTGTGIMAHESIFTSANLEIGDQITVTWVMTLG